MPEAWLARLGRFTVQRVHSGVAGSLAGLILGTQWKLGRSRDKLPPISRGRGHRSN